VGTGPYEIAILALALVGLAGWMQFTACFAACCHTIGGFYPAGKYNSATNDYTHSNIYPCRTL
jgi:hypothetical protein